MRAATFCASSLTSGFCMNSRASTSFVVVRLSMGMGLGPTPRRKTALPQKAWSPKKGMTVVGHAASRPVRHQQRPKRRPGGQRL